MPSVFDWLFAWLRGRWVAAQVGWQLASLVAQGYRVSVMVGAPVPGCGRLNIDWDEDMRCRICNRVLNRLGDPKSVGREVCFACVEAFGEGQ